MWVLESEVIVDLGSTLMETRWSRARARIIGSRGQDQAVEGVVREAPGR